MECCAGALGRTGTAHPVCPNLTLTLITSEFNVDIRVVLGFCVIMKMCHIITKWRLSNNCFCVDIFVDILKCIVCSVKNDN